MLSNPIILNGKSVKDIDIQVSYNMFSFSIENSATLVYYMLNDPVKIKQKYEELSVFFLFLNIPRVIAKLKSKNFNKLSNLYSGSIRSTPTERDGEKTVILKGTFTNQNDSISIECNPSKLNISSECNMTFSTLSAKLRKNYLKKKDGTFSLKEIFSIAPKYFNKENPINPQLRNSGLLLNEYPEIKDTHSYIIFENAIPKLNIEYPRLFIDT